MPNPSSPQFGQPLSALGRLGDAEASCRQAIALRPDYAEAHNNLGITLRELGKLEKLKQAIEKR